MNFIIDIFKAHLFLFSRPVQKLPSAIVVIRFLSAYLVCGVFLLWVTRLGFEFLTIDNPLAERLLLTSALLFTSLIITRIIVGPHWSSLGLRAPRKWTRREVLYAIQIIPLFIFIFYFIIFKNEISEMITANHVTGFLGFNLLYGFIWGVYQEFIYRGVLHTSLVTPLGPLGGLLTANVVYTFGPLHWNYFAMPATQAIPLFAAVFGIGLIFGFLYQRSGNLWLPACLHGLWPLNMIG